MHYDNEEMTAFDFVYHDCILEELVQVNRVYSSDISLNSYKVSLQQSFAPWYPDEVSKHAIQRRAPDFHMPL